MNYKGEITLIIGPMFSGKTTELIRLIKRAQVINRKILCIKYQYDNRFRSDNVIVSRDTKNDDSIVAVISKGNNLSETLREILLDKEKNGRNYDLICVDEIQFYEDGAETCDLYANMGYDIIASGLQGTFERKPFETVSKLISLSENIIHLKALDIQSKKECSFTKRLTSNKELEIIGSDDYIACDRENYFRV